MKEITLSLKFKEIRVLVSVDGGIFNLQGKRYAVHQRKNGYQTVRFSCQLNGVNGGRNFYVHRLVAQAYLGDVEGKVINHLNSLRNDNRLENLEITTAALNTRHAQLNNRFPRHAEYKVFVTALCLHFVLDMPVTGIMKLLNMDRQRIQYWLSGEHKLFAERYFAEGDFLEIGKLKNRGKELRNMTFQ